MFYKTGLCLLHEGILVWRYTELPPAASYLPPIKAVGLARQQEGLGFLNQRKFNRPNR